MREHRLRGDAQVDGGGSGKYGEAIGHWKSPAQAHALSRRTRRF
jgi:hypothetical protein